MVFNTFKEDVVVEKGWATMKEIRKFTIRLAVLVISVAIGVSLFTMSTVGALVTAGVLIMSGLIYVWLIDFSDEEEDNFRLITKISKFWFLGIIFDVVMYIVLKYFMFI